MSDLENEFPEWGDSGEFPPDGFFYEGGDQVNEKHLDALWHNVGTHFDDVVDEFDSVYTDLESVEADLDDHNHQGDTLHPDEVIIHEKSVIPVLDSDPDDPDEGQEWIVME